MKTIFSTFTIYGLLLLPTICLSQLASNIAFEFGTERKSETLKNDTSAYTTHFNGSTEIKESINDIKLQTRLVETDANVGLVESILNSEMALSVVLFDFNKSDLTRSTIYELNRLSRLLQTHPEMILEIVGHTDSYGSNIDNADLSRQRTSAVVYYFKNQSDINEKRLIVKNLGESKPIAGNETEGGRKLNRRVEMKLKTIPVTD